MYAELDRVDGALAPYMPSCSAYASSMTSTLPLQISSSAAVFSSVPPAADAMRSEGVRTSTEPSDR